MRIGIDFDNTIVNYDGVFHAAALERGLIPVSLDRGKSAVRDYLNGSGRMDDFTLLQGYVYGARMDLASPYPGFAEFVTTARQSGHELFIVSHKTRHPIMGPSYDLHEAARDFLEAHEVVGAEVILPSNVFFELTKEKKAARSKELDLEVFVDDLPEILALPDLAGMRRILFTGGNQVAPGDYEIARSWTEVSQLLAENDR